jgi:hypothetical protein
VNDSVCPCVCAFASGNNAASRMRCSCDRSWYAFVPCWAHANDARETKTFQVGKQRMPVDYSKWDNLDLSDDEDAPKKPASRKVEPAAPAKIEKPKEAQGSAWNANNYHFEEQKLDVWGRARLKEILKQTVALEIEHQGQNFPFTMAFGVDKMEADVWSHIRKGKTAVGYNIELELGVDGQVTAGPRQEPVLGSISADLMVRDVRRGAAKQRKSAIGKVQTGRNGKQDKKQRFTRSLIFRQTSTSLEESMGYVLRTSLCLA